MRRCWAAALALVFAVLATAAQAEGTAPRPVTVGIFLNQVFSSDLKGNQFAVDFYVWFRWEGDDLKPLDSFELMNGRITSRGGVIRKKIGNQNYAVARCVATVTKFWDLRRYPLDSHRLTLEIEDAELDERGLQYVADTDNAGVGDSLEVPGWALGAHGGKVQRQVYRTNYGDVSLPTARESAYSRYVFGLDVSRPGYGRFIKVFFGLFVAVMVSWCSFFVRPKDASPRVSLGVGSTFAAAAVTVTINNSLPETNVLTMADQMVMLTLGSIGASIAVSITSLRLFALGKEAIQQRLDRWAAVVIPAGYLATLVSIVR